MYWTKGRQKSLLLQTASVKQHELRSSPEHPVVILPDSLGVRLLWRLRYDSQQCVRYQRVPNDA